VVDPEACRYKAITNTLFPPFYASLSPSFAVVWSILIGWLWLSEIELTEKDGQVRVRIVPKTS
jgi:hypothetical protein